MPFSPLFLGEGSPNKIDDRKKGTLILPSLLEDLETIGFIYIGPVMSQPQTRQARPETLLAGCGQR